ncbi:MAG: right-handed parallel beta-helix repeat-containing protein [bacterium]
MKKIPESTFRIALGTVVALIVLAVYAYPLALASEVHVPDDYSTIQAAIAGANSGDVIVVYEGIYYENIHFLGKAITVKSTDPNDPAIVAATIIDGNQAGHVVKFEAEEGSDFRRLGINALLSGVTVQNGKAEYGGGIYCYYSSPTISNCMIIGNSAGQCGGGIYCVSSSPSITNCIIMGNSTEISTSTEEKRGSGGGIFCAYDSSPDITNCIIARNSTSNGGGIFCQGAVFLSFGMGIPVGGGLPRPKITNCTIVENTASVSGGGVLSNLDVWVYFVEEFLLSGGTFKYFSAPIITSSILWDNYPDQVSGKRIQITFSDIQGWFPGIGNINADPLFVSPEAGDYHLQPGSPCIRTKGKYQYEMGAYGHQVFRRQSSYHYRSTRGY